MTKRRGITATLLALAALGAQSNNAQTTQARSSSGTREMACVVKVTADTGILPLSFDLVEALLHSDSVAGRAGQRTWGSGHSASDGLFDVRPLGGEGLEDGPRGLLPSGDRESVDVAPPAGTRTVVFALHVHIPESVSPAAREFGAALLEHLGNELQEACAACRERLVQQLGDAQTQRETARKELDRLMRQSPPVVVEDIRLDPADQALYEQLERVVDLSAIVPETAVREAFDLLRKSVQPPLNLVVLWRDLLENALIDPTSPVELDGNPAIRLGTALEGLLLALTDPLATSEDYRVDYVVSHGVVTVATRLGLPPKRMETRVYDLPPLLRATGQAPEIAGLIRETIEPTSWFDAYPRSGRGTIASSPDGRLVVSQSHGVHKRIEELLTKLGASSSIALPLEGTPEILMERMECLLPYRAQLEQELDRLQERQGQISRQKNEKERQTMGEALDETANNLHAALMELKTIHAQAVKTDPDAAGKAGLQHVIQEIEECISRCNKGLSDTRSWWSDLRSSPIMPFDWKEEDIVASRIADKQRDLRAVGRRIEDIQRVLTGSSASDPELSHLRRVAERYEQMAIRVHELETRLADLRPCSVQVIGDIR